MSIMGERRERRSVLVFREDYTAPCARWQETLLFVSQPTNFVQTVCDEEEGREKTEREAEAALSASAAAHSKEIVIQGKHAAFCSSSCHVCGQEIFAQEFHPRQLSLPQKKEVCPCLPDVKHTRPRGIKRHVV